VRARQAKQQDYYLFPIKPEIVISERRVEGVSFPRHPPVPAVLSRFGDFVSHYLNLNLNLNLHPSVHFISFRAAALKRQVH
jgi:hypothetical protein